jgi:ribosome maturation factor RimP
MAEPSMNPSIQDTVEDRVSAAEPDVEVLLAEVVGGGTLRVLIDHPDGVSLDLCVRVTHLMDDLRERYAVEVSSPGSDRPLVKPAHYRRFTGRKVRVRTKQPITVADGASGEPRKSFTGELVGSDEHAVTLAADGGVVTIPYAEIHRSNLVEE